MPDHSLLLVGSMGHIGGATLEKLIASHPELRITTLVRSDKDSAILKRQYEHANIKTQIGDLKDTEAMESLARNATIVLNCGPDNNQGLGIKALLRGLAARDTHAYYIGTSGAANIWGPPTGEDEGRVWDDVADIDEIRALPESALHVAMDNIVLGANTPLLHTAIVSPSWVMGVSSSATHPTPLTFPDLLQLVKSSDSGATISKGANRLSFVNVQDLARLYTKLVGDALKRLRTGTHNADGPVEVWGQTAYYFGGSIEASGRELMVEHLLPALKLSNASYPSSDEIKETTLDAALSAVLERLGADAKPEHNRWRVEQYAVSMRVRGSRAEKALGFEWTGGDAGIAEAVKAFVRR